MERLLEAVRELDRYAGPGAEESVWQGGGTMAVPLRLLIDLRAALHAVQDYNESGIHECMGCSEPTTAPLTWCSRCERNRRPHPEGANLWDRQ